MTLLNELDDGKQRFRARYWVAMSEENVEIIRRDYEAFDRGDFAAFLDDLHPEIVTWAHPRGDAGRYEGKDGVIRFITEWTESFEEFSQIAEEFKDADEKVLVRVLHRGRGKGSGIPVEAHYWLVHHMRDGKTYPVDLYDNEAEALEVVAPDKKRRSECASLPG